MPLFYFYIDNYSRKCYSYNRMKVVRDKNELKFRKQFE